MKLPQFERRVICNIGTGEFYATEQRDVIRTLVGSCIAVCLYDPDAHVVGMNHFLLACDKSNKMNILHSRASYYGLYAMELLINAMLARGANRYKLNAKLFGGANVFLNINHGIPTVGESNITFARDFLKNENIPIVSQDVGGMYGRILYFDASDFAVYRSTIIPACEQKVIARENRYGKTNGQKIKYPATPIRYWD